MQAVTAVGAYPPHYEAKTHLRRNLPRRNLRRGTYVYALDIPTYVTRSAITVIRLHMCELLQGFF